MEEVATAAGVTRQTVYARYPSRPLLVAAVVDRITAEATAALDAADLDSGSKVEALLTWLEVTWRLFDHYPLLQHPSVTAMDRSDADQRHAPVANRLERLISSGQAAGEFDDKLDPNWLVSATVVLGHAAGSEVTAGRMTAAEATEALRHSILRIYGVERT